MKLTQKIQETFQSLKKNFSQGIFMYDSSLAKSQDGDYVVQPSNPLWQSFRKGLMMGFGIMLGMFGTGVMAVAVTGTIKTWTANEKLTASDLNTTIASLKTAIESIPNWTKNGTSAYYNDGNVGIGTNSPTEKLQVNGNLLVNGNITSQNTGQKIVAYPTQSAGNPDYTWVGQTTTGMFLPASGQIGFSTGGTERMRINANGNMGIGTTSSSFPNQDSLHPLQVNLTGDTRVRVGNDSKYIEQIKDAGGNNNNWLTSFGSTLFIIENQSGPLVFHVGYLEKMRLLSNGNLGIGTASPSTTLHVAGSACSTGGGMTACASDKRLKENIQPITLALDTILKIKPVTFSWNQTAEKEFIYKSGQKDIGVIAQDIEKINPEWVETAPNGYKRVKDTFAKWYVIGAIQELKGLLDNKEKSHFLVSEKQEKELKDMSLRLRTVTESYSNLTEENAELKKQLGELRKENHEVRQKSLSFEERLKALEEMRYAKK